VWTRYPFFWNMALRHWIICSRCFETSYSSHLQEPKCPRRFPVGHNSVSKCQEPVTQRQESYPRERMPYKVIRLLNKTPRKCHKDGENIKNEYLRSVDAMIFMMNRVGVTFFRSAQKLLKKKSLARVLVRFIKPRRLSVVSRFHHPL
jgi:hypothetical protein